MKSNNLLEVLIVEISSEWITEENLQFGKRKLKKTMNQDSKFWFQTFSIALTREMAGVHRMYPTTPFLNPSESLSMIELKWLTLNTQWWILFVRFNPCRSCDHPHICVRSAQKGNCDEEHVQCLQYIYFSLFIFLPSFPSVCMPPVATFFSCVSSLSYQSTTLQCAHLHSTVQNTTIRERSRHFLYSQTSHWMSEWRLFISLSLHYSIVLFVYLTDLLA